MSNNWKSVKMSPPPEDRHMLLCSDIGVICTGHLCMEANVFKADLPLLQEHIDRGGKIIWWQKIHQPKNLQG